MTPDAPGDSPGANFLDDEDRRAVLPVDRRQQPRVTGYLIVHGATFGQVYVRLESAYPVGRAVLHRRVKTSVKRQV